MASMIVLWKGGYATWGALSWIDGIGATFVHLDRSGANGRSLRADRDLISPDCAAQKPSPWVVPVGLAITKYLLTAKPDREARGQRAILSDVLTPDRESARTLDLPLERIATCDDARDALADEAQAALLARVEGLAGQLCSR